MNTIIYKESEIGQKSVIDTIIYKDVRIVRKVSVTCKKKLKCWINTLRFWFFQYSFSSFLSILTSMLHVDSNIDREKNKASRQTRQTHLK